MALARPPLLKRFLTHMEHWAPLSLADTTWDNVGLLLEAPEPSIAETSKPGRILLTIDLTESVYEEARAFRQAGHPVILMAYHPVIFRPLKQLTFKDVKQRLSLLCIAQGISVFCPHTALDACVPGINDWLLDAFDVNQKKHWKPIVPVSSSQHPETGMGRIMQLSNPISLEDCVQRVKRHLNLPHVRLARAANSKSIQSVAVCAGSGASILSKVQADLYITGEMGHHEVLAAVADGTNVILCEHTNTERGYLRDILQPNLQRLFNEDGGEVVQVVCSQSDKDPLEVV